MEKKFSDYLVLGGKLFVLNLLWILFSLPLITIGSSSCALCYVSLKLLDKKEGNIFKWFIKSFKDNLLQGTVMWLFVCPVIYSLFLSWNLVIQEEAGFVPIILCVFVTLFMLYTLIYVFPVISHYKNSLKSLIKNSLGIALHNFAPTLFLGIIIILCILIWQINKFTMIVGLFIMPVDIFYTICSKVNPIFKRLETNE